MALSESELKDIESLLNRAPSTVETHIFDTMWSEHCSYKSSKSVLKQLPTKGQEVALGVGEDSGIIRLAMHNGEQYCLAVSHESHNHPSQILPIEGAATGVGGVVRDVYCMGADVIGVLDSLHFGVSDSDNSLVDEIAEKVVLGVSGYGNPLGVPVLGGETLYHPSYNDNCLVNVAALGLVKESDIIHSYVPKDAQEVPYDVILIGKSTDATGFGGASFSSASLDSEDEMANLGAVQVHDPFMKRVIVTAIKRLFEYVKENQVPIGFKDLGAGGISCAASELAVSGGFGVTINLDQVNVAIENLDPEVIACSETQERFCLVAPRSHSEAICKIFNDDYELPKMYPNAGASIIGEIIQEKTFIMSYEGKEVCHLPVTAITTDVKADRSTEKRDIHRDIHVTPQLTQSLSSVCVEVIENKNNASKRGIYRFYDNAVRGDTVLYPGEADAVIVAPIEGNHTGVAVSIDSNTYGFEDPYLSGAEAVAESVRNIIAVGARPIAITDCLNYGSPENPSVFFDFQEGVRGISEAANALSFISNEPIPIISGNVSFYNESKQGRSVVPSPVILCVGKMEDYRHLVRMQIREPNIQLLLIGERIGGFAGTQIAPYLEGDLGGAPGINLAEQAQQNQAVYHLISQQLIHACHDISMGGVWQALVEMALGEKGPSLVGLDITAPETTSVASFLFAENGGYILAVNTQNLDPVTQYLASQNIHYHNIGQSTSLSDIKIHHQDKEQAAISLSSLMAAWSTYCHK